MYRSSISSGCRSKVCIEPIGIERCNRSHELGNCFEASIKRLICRQFIFRHRSAPEAFTVQPNIPVTEIVIYKIRYSPPCTSRLVSGKLFVDFFNQRVQKRDNPTVYFRPFFHRNLGFTECETVYIGIQSEERIGVIQRSKELATNFLHTFQIEFEVIPRRRIGNHIPT